jgi:hypothetical protein
MKLTNNLNLPAPIFAAVANDRYTKGDAQFSVTGLLDPPQIHYLAEKHFDKLTEDVSDRIWSLLGQAVHHIIERAGDSLETFSETTLYTMFEGTKLKGTIDHMAMLEGSLEDFKVTNVRKLKGGRVPFEWIAQTNIYKWLIERETPHRINSINVIAIFRDWNKREAQFSSDYPSRAVERVFIPLWSDIEVEMFLRERIALLSTDEPAPCTEEEIWAKPTTYALMKKGNKRAVKVFQNFAEAEEARINLGSAGSVETRHGEATRCASYCAVAAFCPQWAADPRNPRNAPPLSPEWTL